MPLPATANEAIAAPAFSKIQVLAASSVRRDSLHDPIPQY
jgi:hypothetical protein